MWGSQETRLGPAGAPKGSEPHRSPQDAHFEFAKKEWVTMGHPGMPPASGRWGKFLCTQDHKAEVSKVQPLDLGLMPKDWLYLFGGGLAGSVLTQAFTAFRTWRLKPSLSFHSPIA